MPIIEISSLSHKGVEVFASLTETQLRHRLDPEKGIFIAESPKVISVALNAGYVPVALLCEGKHITWGCSRHYPAMWRYSCLHGKQGNTIVVDWVHPYQRCALRHETSTIAYDGSIMQGLS